MADTRILHMVDHSQTNKQFYWEENRNYTDEKTYVSSPQISWGNITKIGYHEGEQSKLYFGSWHSSRILDMLTENLIKDMNEKSQERLLQDQSLWKNMGQEIYVQPVNVNVNYGSYTSSGTSLQNGNHGKLDIIDDRTIK